MQVSYYDIMMLNKMITFIDNMISDAINLDFFIEKINFDLYFINQKVSEFWGESFKYKNQDDSSDKSFYYVLKKFLRLLNNIKNRSEIYNSYTFDRNNFSYIYETISERLHLLNKREMLSKIKNTEKQFINEEEYNLLLNIHNSMEE